MNNPTLPLVSPAGIPGRPAAPTEYNPYLAHPSSDSDSVFMGAVSRLRSHRPVYFQQSKPDPQMPDFYDCRQNHLSPHRRYPHGDAYKLCCLYRSRSGLCPSSLDQSLCCQRFRAILSSFKQSAQIRFGSAFNRMAGK